MKDTIIGMMIINLHGSVVLNRTTEYLDGKKVNYSNRKPGLTPRYAYFSGISHDVELSYKQCTRRMPISETTWNYWMNNPPSYAELQRFGKGKKSQIKTFKQQDEFTKAMCHARDICSDAGGRSVQIEL